MAKEDTPLLQKAHQAKQTYGDGAPVTSRFAFSAKGFLVLAIVFGIGMFALLEVKHDYPYADAGAEDLKLSGYQLFQVGDSTDRAAAYSVCYALQDPAHRGPLFTNSNLLPFTPEFPSNALPYNCGNGKCTWCRGTPDQCRQKNADTSRTGFACSSADKTQNYGFLHFFGYRPEGYRAEVTTGYTCCGLPSVATQRITAGLKNHDNWVRAHGLVAKPKVLMMQSNYWDINIKLLEFTGDLNPKVDAELHPDLTTVTAFYADTEKRKEWVDDYREQLKATISVVKPMVHCLILRTQHSIVGGRYPPEIVDMFNAVIKEVGSEAGVPVFDWAREVNPAIRNPDEAGASLVPRYANGDLSHPGLKLLQKSAFPSLNKFIPKACGL